MGKGSAQSMAWSPDGSLLAVDSSTGIYLYDTQTWAVVKTIAVSDLEGKISVQLAFSPDGKELIFPTWSQPATFWRYDLQSGTFRLWFEDASLELPSAPVFSPDGHVFAILNYICEADIRPCSHTLELRDRVTGKVIYQLPKGSSEQDNAIAVFVFSPDGKQIAWASNDHRIRVWDTANGSLLYELRHNGNVTDICYSPDGKVLASTGKDAVVRFWNAQTSESLLVLRGFKQELQQVAYLENGEKLLVGQLYSNRFQEYTLDDRYLPDKALDWVLELGKGDSEYYRPDANMLATITTTISPDTRKMATLLNNTIQIWNLDSGKLVLTLPGYSGTISRLAFSPDGSLMAVADHNIHLWNISTRTWLATLPIGTYGINDVVFRPNSHQIAIVTGGGEVQFWDTNSYQKIRANDDDLKLCNSSHIAFSADGKKLAIAGWCGIRIWEPDSGQLEQKLELEERTPYQIAFNPDGTDLLSVDEHGLRRWNLKTGNLVYSIDLSNEYNNWSVAIGSNLMVLGKKQNGPFLFFNPITGQHLYDFAKGCGGNVVALHPDQRLLARADDRKILLLDSASGNQIAAIDFNLPYLIAFSPDRQTLAVSSSYTGMVHLWNIASLAQRVAGAVSPTATPHPGLTPTPTVTPQPILPISIQSWQPPILEANAIHPENVAQLKMLNELGNGYVRVVAWSIKGDLLAIGGGPGVFIFQWGAEQPLRLLPVEQDIFRLAFSPDGRLLAGQINNDYSVRVWEVATGRSLYTLKNASCWNREMVFSPDSQILSTVCSVGTYRWNMVDGQLLSKKEGDIHADVSPDGLLAVDVSMSSARLVTANSGEIIQTFDVPGLAPNLARFSPDGKTLLVWFYQFEIAHTGIYFLGKDHENLIQLWNIAPGQNPTLRATLVPGKLYLQTMLDAAFHGLEFSPDSRRIFTASGDGQVQIWDITSGNLLSTLQDSYQIYLSPDGTRLTALGKKIKVWDVSPGKTPVILWDIPGFGDFRSLLGLAGRNHDLVTVAQGEFQFWAHRGITVAVQPRIVTGPDPLAISQAVSPDGKWLAYSAATDLMLGENDSAHPNWRSLEKLSNKSFLNGLSEGTVVVFSPNSSSLAVIDADRKLSVWQLNEPQATPLELARKMDYGTNLIFSPDSQLLLGVHGSSSQEQSVYLWEISSGKLLRTWKTKGYLFAFNPGEVVLAVSDPNQNKIFLFDLRTWKLLREIQGQKYINEIVFNPDGSLLAISNSAGLEFWDVANDKLLKTAEGAFGRLFFSPDGKELIVSTGDGRIQIWGLPEK
jgi:WD40 repeat protein